MRVNSIIAIPEGSLRDSFRECRVAGTLYELAEETYEEETPDTMSVENYAGPQVTLDQIASNSMMETVDTSHALKSGNGPDANASAAPITHSQRPPPDSPVNFPNLPSASLPKPPDGFKFRPILKTGSEIVLDASLISGRYYPELLKHPLLQNTLVGVDSTDARVSQLTALCGLLPGTVNSMECVDWAPTRIKMIQHADVTAHEDLLQHWHPPETETTASNNGVANDEVASNEVANDVVVNKPEVMNNVEVVNNVEVMNNLEMGNTVDVEMKDISTEA